MAADSVAKVSSSEPKLYGYRRAAVLTAWVPLLSPVMPCAVAVWLLCASVPVGGPGPRAVLWLAVLGVPLAILLWVSGALMLVDCRFYAPRCAGTVPVVFTCVAWVGAGALGIFLPDVIDGQERSIFMSVVGAESVGLSAGFANTVGVLTFVAAVGAVIAAALDLRVTRARLRGEPDELSLEEEDRLRQQWLDSFV